ncbi:hypothetical protein DCAR_0623331 [Daucus carota subsp. sativus]|uniref:Uncharacterized protein n=1 Tax=Daucus carota subsp. sativus TaxID=79200 RepID=A0A175YC64_DAUCS|nr:hypothetical protein DCAR_0623331 [Daucus carota subsp. sativus]
MEHQSGSLKRKHYEVLKNDLSVELTKLTEDSRNLHISFRSAREDFELMCKSMADRQADFLTRSLFLEEKYDEVLGVLDRRVTDQDGESVGENVVLSAAYAATFHRFLTDSGHSLKNLGVLMEEENKEMDVVFEKYETIWKQNMKELKERAGLIENQRAKLSAKLLEFNRYEIIDSDSD